MNSFWPTSRALNVKYSGFVLKLFFFTNLNPFSSHGISWLERQCLTALLTREFKGQNESVICVQEPKFITNRNDEMPII